MLFASLLHPFSLHWLHMPPGSSLIPFSFCLSWLVPISLFLWLQPILSLFVLYHSLLSPVLILCLVKLTDIILLHQFHFLLLLFLLNLIKHYSINGLILMIFAPISLHVSSHSLYFPYFLPISLSPIVQLSNYFHQHQFLHPTCQTCSGRLQPLTCQQSFQLQQPIRSYSLLNCLVLDLLFLLLSCYCPLICLLVILNRLDTFLPFLRNEY